ncbi:hypothetical protein SDC9_111554 [bioreactor metagenome]|uniref:Uncharacterized protein n=1 Tax=bioreactor metagenome TaxID=1076179 RepID=A0A645BHL6_9ZZZZ
MIPLHLIQILLALEGFDNEEFIPARNSIKAVAQFFDQNPEQLKKAEMLRETTEEELKKYLHTNK